MLQAETVASPSDVLQVDCHRILPPLFHTLLDRAQGTIPPVLPLLAQLMKRPGTAHEALVLFVRDLQRDAVELKVADDSV